MTRRRRHRSYSKRQRERNSFLVRFGWTVLTVAGCGTVMGIVLSFIHAALLRESINASVYPSRELVALWSTFGIVFGLWLSARRRFYKYVRLKGYSDGLRGRRRR